MNNSLDNIKLILSQSFDLAATPTDDVEAFLDVLAMRVQYEMDFNLEHFFSLLYRLDIEEKSIKAVLKTQDNIPKKIAVLIYERQLEKMISRKQFPTTNVDEELSW